MTQYNPKEIEPRWQQKWADANIYKTPEHATKTSKMYILPQLPYPSGSGLHVGHAEVYTACDVYARYQRMIGKDVLQVIGWDSFGLPAENYAIKTNVHPRKSTNDAVDNFRNQIKQLGISVDWEREVGSHNPDYYKWTQWFFLLMYKRGLAYRKKQSVNWCESCKTVLANEQVTNAGKCERCDTVVLQKEMEQWYLKITDYADKLLEGLDRIDWPEETKKRQKDWIGRSEGAEIEFELKGQNSKVKVFTTRPDTIFGATYLVLAPEHGLLNEIKTKITNWDEVHAYILKTQEKTDLDRQVDQEKTGVELKGIRAVNPVSGEEISVWIADYVLASYGTGAIMAVPAHDERDFAFAKKFQLPIRHVVAQLGAHYVPPQEYRQGVYAVVQNSDGKFLIQKDIREGYYRLPGGTQEKDESEITTLQREFVEETGYTNFAIQERIGNIAANFITKNRKIPLLYLRSAYIVSLLDNTQQEVVSEEDGGRFEYLWVTYEEALRFFAQNPQDTAEQLFLTYVFEKRDCFSGEGIVMNSAELNYLPTTEAKEKIIAYLEEKGIGKRKVQYKLRDWSVSRQRFWGAPIPMLYDEKGELHPVPESDLPVILPDDVDFKPTGESPLRYSESFNAGVEEKYGTGWKREPDTLDTFMCSSWYYYRYLDPKNDTAFVSPEALKAWMPVDFYLGGEEHVNGHLLYSRFFTKVLYDAGYIDFDEPFTVHRHQGLILGEDSRKMSKRWGNVINPTDIVNEYGADTCRMYEMFMGPLEEAKPWSTGGVKGVRRFLDKVWALQEKVSSEAPSSKEFTALLHKTIKKVTDDTTTLQYNTAIAKMMECVNAAVKESTIGKKEFELLLLLLAPYAPHVTEELWNAMGNTGFIAQAKWPSYEESLLVEETATLAVQVNGKLRGTIVVDAGIDEEEAKRLAFVEPNVVKWMEGKEPKKVIYIKGKLVSIVV
ncbi:MAG: class I tRNA ligase family protein [Candidatus Magasanikbacteria bacterium]|nr:class I tRNA ligase family protein [Candidatus Magasanikbacteria bacterium]